MSKIKIWHNNRCSKSREAKGILEERKEDFEVWPSLKTTKFNQPKTII